MKLDITCVNKVRIERVEEFTDSIFSNVYMTAKMDTEKIMAAMHKQEYDDPAEVFCNGDEMSNIISFVGERGMGKSSAMLSYAYFLRQYPESKTQDFQFQQDEIQFYTLTKIDAGILSHESVFDVILAKMWNTFSKEMEMNGLNDGRCNRLKESFNLLKDAYSQYYGRNEEARRLVSVRQLSELAIGLTLREKFANLVKDFLDCMISNKMIAQSNRYLVIPIDDLDLFNDSTTTVLEPLRVFLSVPHVIILTTVDIDKLRLGEIRELSIKLLYKGNVEKYEKENVRQYADQYIAKTLPRNNRIYMPSYDGTLLLKYNIWDNGNLEHDDGGEPSNYFEYINIKIAQYLNFLLNYNEDVIEEGESLRNIVNRINELKAICSQEGSKRAVPMLYNWLEKEIIISRENILNSEQAIFLKSLMKAQPKGYNVKVGAYISKLIGDKTDGIDAGTGYGKILSLLADYLGKYPEEKRFVKKICILYSICILKCKEENRIENTIIKEDILSSVLNDDFLGRNTLKAGALLLQMKTPQDDIKIVFTENKQKVLELFKILLFCDFESFLEKSIIEETVKLESQRTLVGFQENKETIREYHIKNDGKTVVSVDFFFRNIARCEELYTKYIEWLYSQLCRCKSIKKKNSIRKNIQKCMAHEIQEVKKVIEQYEIKDVYDILPVQNMELMVQVVQKVKQCREKFSNEKLISNNMSLFAELFKETFETVEKNCKLENRRYGSILYSLMNAICLNELSEDGNDVLIVTASKVEKAMDTTNV